MPSVLLIDHPPPTLPDRVTGHLESCHWQVQRCCPAHDEPIPDEDGFDAVVLLGGAPMIGRESAHPCLRNEYRMVDARLRSGRPMLGFGFGAQVIAHVMGAEVGPLHSGEVEMGWYPVRSTPAGAAVLPPEMMVFAWHSHGFGVPFGATRLAASPLYINQAVKFAPAVYGFQFRADMPPAAQEELLATIGEDPATERAIPAWESRRLAGLHDAEMADWLAGFLDRWIAESGLGFLRAVPSVG